MADYDAGCKVFDQGNFQQALKELKPVAEQGDANAQTNLGGHYAEGLGVKQDYATAYMWFALAAGAGHEVASRNQTFLHSKMTAQQVRRGEQQAREWLDKHPHLRP